jgi:serine/threonine protein kinase
MQGMAKICDFGWSVYCPKEFRSTLCGTPLYLSPEMLAGRAYNKKVDIWAIGAITHELVTATDPFKIKNSDDLSRIITEDFEMHEGSPELRSFVSFILRKNPAKRPDAETLLMHPYIEKYRGL